MRNSEKNLLQTSKAGLDVTSNSRNELPTVTTFFKTQNPKLFTITATKEYCYIRFKTMENKFFYAKSKTFIQAYALLIEKISA